jgi:hypothetical protein
MILDHTPALSVRLEAHLIKFLDSCQGSSTVAVREQRSLHCFRERIAESPTQTR